MSIVLVDMRWRYDGVTMVYERSLNGERTKEKWKVYGHSTGVE